MTSPLATLFYSQRCCRNCTGASLYNLCPALWWYHRWFRNGIVPVDHMGTRIDSSMLPMGTTVKCSETKDIEHHSQTIHKSV